MSSFSGRLGRLGLGGLGERVKSLRRGGHSATADGDGWAAGAADGWTAPPPAAAAAHPSTGIVVGSATATTDEEAEAVLRELAPGYFDPPSEFDALEHELRQLPVDFTQEQLESVAEDRTAVLEVRCASVQQRRRPLFNAQQLTGARAGRVPSRLPQQCSPPPAPTSLCCHVRLPAFPSRCRW